LDERCKFKLATNFCKLDKFEYQRFIRPAHPAKQTKSVIAFQIDILFWHCSGISDQIGLTTKKNYDLIPNWGM
jgi:hypothetical protein